MPVNVIVVRPFRYGGSVRAASAVVEVSDQDAKLLVSRGDATYQTPPAPVTPIAADHEHTPDQIQWDAGEHIADAGTDLSDSANGAAIATAVNGLAGKLNAVLEILEDNGLMDEAAD